MYLDFRTLGKPVIEPASDAGYISQILILPTGYCFYHPGLYIGSTLAKKF